MENKEKKKTIQLDELLSESDIKSIANYFSKKDFSGVKSFLNSPEIKIKLESKGVLPDYLYYQLEYIFSTQ